MSCNQSKEKVSEKVSEVGCPYSCLQPVEPNLPYDELSQEAHDNVLRLRVTKGVGRIQRVGGPPDGPTLDAECVDENGNKCRPGCARVHVIPNKAPPKKKPDEAMFVLRASRQILGDQEMRNTLEIEFRTPRNYEPLKSALECEKEAAERAAARKAARVAIGKADRKK